MIPNTTRYHPKTTNPNNRNKKNMEAYLLTDFCGQGARIVVHPRGLPPSWKHSGLTADQEELARHKAYQLGPEFRHHVVHLDPATFEHLESFKVR